MVESKVIEDHIVITFALICGNGLHLIFYPGLSVNIKSSVFSWRVGTSIFLLNESILSLLLKLSHTCLMVC